MSRSWVIEKDIFEENEAKLEALLGDRLIWCTNTIDGITFSREPGECFIFYGTHTIGRRLQASHRAICWLYDAAYDCIEYLPKFRWFALNNPHILSEAGNLQALLAAIGETTFFIKENAGYKNFTGFVYNKDSAYLTGTLFDEELMLLAPVKKIGAEWRYVIGTNCLDESPHRIISFSPYGEIKSEADPTAFVNEVLEDPKVRSYDPAPMWTLDVCELPEGKFAVVEVNSLLSAGWYDCDVDLIVKTVDEIIMGPI